MSTLLLIDFFIVTIPLTHAGYFFLSSLNIDNVKKNIQRNSSASFIAIFIISIIQVAFLFFLANSIANVEKPEDISIQSLQSQLFIFWLTLTAMMAGAGSILVKIIMKQNRIPIEWVLLYAFLVGFLITMSLTIFVSNSLGNEQGLQLFNVTLLVVLLIRAALDYVIGQRIYFPKSS